MTTQIVTVEEIKEAISAGRSNYQPESTSGCGRVYVCVGSYRDGDEREPATKKENQRRTRALRLAITTAAQSLGILYQTNGHQVKHALYVGYDNNSGVELGQGTAIAANLKALGIPAYRDEVAD